MRAPSSEREASEIAAEIAARPNLRAVTECIHALLADDPGPLRRDGLERLVGSLDVGLEPTEDISEGERDEWLKVLA